MKGDFSRGHTPDNRRGRRYRRILLQQGRLLLDSDVAALVDAQDRNLREVARHTGCPAGSPDLGFLVTPGRLLALFRDIDSVTVTAGTLEVRRDFQVKYLDRYPSLYLGANSGVNGTAQIQLRSQASGSIDLWMRAAVAATVSVGGVNVNPPVQADLGVVTVALGAATTTLDIVLNTGEEVWIGLIEEHHDATQQPEFSAAAGNFHIDGLVLHNLTDRYYPGINFPTGPGFAVPDLQIRNPANTAPRNLAANDRLVAYLEGYERHITFVEDGGIREPALGSTIDTTTRTQALGQVKVAAALGLTGEQIQAAFENRLLPTGTLAITLPPANPNPDPCALPASGGYTGLDNRLYRFEVHTGGPLANVLLKWSRDNGSEYFSALSATAAQLSFTAGTDLQPGDLVEVLSERIDRSDSAIGFFDAVSNRFVAPERSVGQLVRLVSVAAPPGSADLFFTLVDPFDDTLVVNLTLADFGDPANPQLRVRRWHGLIRRDNAADPYVVRIENGIEVRITGGFSAGDYWLFEARAGNQAAAGFSASAPHGPERLFAPLALLEFGGSAQPLSLRQWLDDRFVPLCELTADDIAFDGDRIGTDSDTVQEVIEELWERERGGCCDATLEPDSGDTVPRIEEILNSTTGHIEICLRRGLYQFNSPLQIANRRVTIRGCPNAIILAQTGGAAPFRVMNGGHLLLAELTVFASRESNVRVLVRVEEQATGLTASATGFIVQDPNRRANCIVVGNLDGAAFSPNNPVAFQVNTPVQNRPFLRLEECVLVAGWAILATQLELLSMTRCAAFCIEGGVQALIINTADLDETSFAVGLRLEVTVKFTPQDLLRNPDPLLELLAGIASTEPSIALQISSLFGGSIGLCTFRSLYGVAIGQADGVAFEGNRYAVRGTAVYVINSSRVAFRSERVEPGADFGFHFSAMLSAVRVVDCFISARQAGIRMLRELGSTAPSASLRIASFVTISGNQIGTEADGIVAGSENFRPNFIAGMTIEANQISAPGRAIYLVLPGPQQVPQYERSVHMSGNMIAAIIGLWQDGGSCEFEGNQVHLPFPRREFPGIMLLNTTGTVVESNLIEIANMITDGRPTAILIQGGNNARISDNVVRHPRTAVALSSQAHPSLQVTGNDFATHACEVRVASTRLDWFDNQTQNVSIVSSANGHIHGNRANDLAITGPSGNWSINDNYATGTISIIPLTTNLLYPYAGQFSVNTESGFISNTINGLAGTSNVIAPAAGAMNAVYDPGWMTAWETEARSNIAGTYATAAPQQTVVALPSQVVTSEAAYEATVDGNVCTALSVGGPPSDSVIVVGPVVMVTANRVRQLLRVQNYRDAIVVHNAAAQLSTWIGRQTNRINGPNLQR